MLQLTYIDQRIRYTQPTRESTGDKTITTGVFCVPFLGFVGAEVPLKLVCRHWTCKAAISAGAERRCLGLVKTESGYASVLGF